MFFFTAAFRHRKLLPYIQLLSFHLPWSTWSRSDFMHHFWVYDLLLLFYIHLGAFLLAFYPMILKNTLLNHSKFLNTIITLSNRMIWWLSIMILIVIYTCAASDWLILSDRMICYQSSVMETELLVSWFTVSINFCAVFDPKCVSRPKGQLVSVLVNSNMDLIFMYSLFWNSRVFVKRIQFLFGFSMLKLLTRN